MLARHAESLFWAGREIERAESTARMLDVTYHGLLEAMPWEAERSWMDLLKVLWLDRPFAELETSVRAATVSEFLVFDPDNPGAIVSSVGAARENARAARELISTRAVGGAQQLPPRAAGPEPAGRRGAAAARALRVREAQLPDDRRAWRARPCPATTAGGSSMLGWMLERAEMTCRLLDVRYSQLVTAGATGGFHHWLQTLKSASGSEAFRRRYRASMDPADVVEFLLLSRTFPRSVLFCLRSAENDLARLEAGSGNLARPQRLLGRTRSDLEFLDTHELLEGDLHVFLDQLLNGVRQVAEAVALQYFRGAQEHDVHSLGALRPGRGGRAR